MKKILDGSAKGSADASRLEIMAAIEREIQQQESAKDYHQEDWRWRQGFISGLHKAHSIASVSASEPSKPSRKPTVVSPDAEGGK